jgi:hypothetical protein
MHGNLLKAPAAERKFLSDILDMLQTAPALAIAVDAGEGSS